MRTFTLKRLFVITLWIAVACWVVNVHSGSVKSLWDIIPIYKDWASFDTFNRDYILSLRCVFGFIFFSLFIWFSWQWSIMPPKE